MGNIELSIKPIDKSFTPDLRTENMVESLLESFWKSFTFPVTFHCCSRKFLKAIFKNFQF